MFLSLLVGLLLLLLSQAGKSIDNHDPPAPWMEVGMGALASGMGLLSEAMTVLCNQMAVMVAQL